MRIGTTDYFDIPFYNAPNSYGFSVSMTAIDTDKVGKVTFNGSYGHLDSFRDSRNIPVSEVEGATGPRDLVNLSVDWANVAGSPFSATIFARNAFDQNMSSARNPSSAISVSPTGNMASRGCTA